MMSEGTGYIRCFTDGSLLVISAPGVRQNAPNVRYRYQQHYHRWAITLFRAITLPTRSLVVGSVSTLWDTLRGGDVSLIRSFISTPNVK